MPESQQNCARLRGLPRDFDVKGEAIMGSKGDYQQAVAKHVDHEMRLLEKGNTTERALLSQYHTKETETCSICRKGDYIARNCWKMNNSAGKTNDTRKLEGVLNAII